MSIIGRSFTYGKRIKVSQEDFDLALSGFKTCTIRLGELQMSSPSMEMHDGSRFVTIQVEKVEKGILYRDLDENHARCEGFDTLAELRNDLAKYYRNLEEEQPMTIIHFKLAGT
jgi:hypothetical protein